MFHIRLEKERLKKKFTQEEIANRIGVARTTYANYENGKREPSFEMVQKIADVLETTTDYLLTGQVSVLSREDQEILEKIKNDPELDIFFKDFASAAEEHQRDLIKIWKALHGKDKDQK